MDQYLSRFPRVSLAHTPTALEFMPRYSALFDQSLYIKRDDCTGLGMGGNKARQLEFYLGQAVDQRCDCVISTGAVQSNNSRMLAAAASKLGLECHIQLESRVENDDPDYHQSGNVFLGQLLGANLHYFQEGENESGADEALQDLADSLTEQGKRPYIIPLSEGHFPYGALGYMAAAGELQRQFEEQNITPDLIVVGSGSGSTHTGLLAGFRLLGNAIPVLGTCVRRDAILQKKRIKTHCRFIADSVGEPNLIDDNDIWLEDAALAPGYGKASDFVLESIKTVARSEGVLLDPAYSGKTFACLAGMLKNGALSQYKTIVVVHTGGTPALFSYRKVLQESN